MILGQNSQKKSPSLLKEKDLEDNKMKKKIGEGRLKVWCLLLLFQLNIK